MHERPVRAGCPVFTEAADEGPVPWLGMYMLNHVVESCSILVIDFAVTVQIIHHAVGMLLVDKDIRCQAEQMGAVTDIAYRLVVEGVR